MWTEIKSFRRVLCFLLSIITACTCFVGVCDAETETDALINEIVASKSGGIDIADIQRYADGKLTQNVGNGNEWYAFALSRIYPELDLTKYGEALSEYVNSKKTVGAMALQRYALVLTASGCESEYTVTRALNESIGEQGIMSFVFGLILLSSGLPSKNTDSNACIEDILSLEISGGGWALSGAVPDADVTAMTISALAPYYQESAVAGAIERGIVVLSGLQEHDGTFSSYGVQNPESTAQVIIALCSLGIEPLTDARFIKDGNTLLDGMLRYRLGNGKYCHVYGGAENENATVQVLLALAAMKRLQEGKGGIYIFDGLNYTEGEPPQITDEQSDIQWYKTYRIYLLIGCAGAAVFLTVYLLVKKRKFKDILFVWAITGAIVTVGFLLNIQTPDQFYSENEELGEAIGNVSITVEYSVIEGREGFTDGMLISETDVILYDGDTVLDVLKRICKTEKISLDVAGGYVSGISGIYEFDHGPMSGWIYTVNGNMLSCGCDEYTLSDGDKVVFSYTV